MVAVAEPGVAVFSVGDPPHTVKAVAIRLDVRDIKPSARRAIDRLNVGS